jgi:iron(III) transport system ATP-binding protein
MSAIEVRAAVKSFDTTTVLCGVDLTVPVGSITAVLGASGSGKTTLLRLIAGFERLDSGTLSIGDRTVDDGRRTVAPQHRGIGYVPQEGALFPHLTVIGNIAFGLSRRDRGKAEHLVDLTGLGELRRRFPHQLSGGQQQRVALARALAIGPQVVLLDEPFGALDASLRGDLGRDVARILRETQTTAILVTHDQDEALSLADQIALLVDGRVRAAAAPRSLYREPPDAVTATTIGEANLLRAETSADLARCALGSIPVRRNGATLSDGSSWLLIRPEQLVLHREELERTTSAIVVELQYHGHDALARVRLVDDRDHSLMARVPGDLDLSPGDKVWIEVVGAGSVWPSPERAGQRVDQG